MSEYPGKYLLWLLNGCRLNKKVSKKDEAFIWEAHDLIWKIWAIENGLPKTAPRFVILPPGNKSKADAFGEWGYFTYEVDGDIPRLWGWTAQQGWRAWQLEEGFF